MIISAVVALYNKEAFVRRALDSILTQTPPVAEVIVVDDGSTDQGPAIVADLRDSRISLIRQPNSGAAAARNRGIEAASGELIALLDADDYWMPGFTDAILRLAEQFPQAGLYATGVGRCWLDGRPDLHTSIKTIGEQQGSTLVQDYFAALREGDFITSSNIAIRKSALAVTGLFPEGVAYGEDQQLWGRLAMRFPFACDPRVLAYYFTPARREIRYSGDRQPVIPCLAEFLVQELHHGAMPEHLVLSAAALVDHLLLRNWDQLVWQRDMARLEQFLAVAPFQDRKLAARALHWRRFAFRLPAGLVHSGWRMGKRLQRIFGPPEKQGQWLVHRRAPCVHL